VVGRGKGGKGGRSAVEDATKKRKEFFRFLIIVTSFSSL